MNSKDVLIDAFANWLFTLVVLPATLISLIQNFGTEFVFNDLAKLILEFVFIGMLPLIIVFIRKENWKNYGFTLTNWEKSIAYGLILAVPFVMIKGYAYFFLGYVG